MVVGGGGGAGGEGAAKEGTGAVREPVEDSNSVVVLLEAQSRPKWSCLLSSLHAITRCFRRCILKSTGAVLGVKQRLSRRQTKRLRCYSPVSMSSILEVVHERW